jgi:hypothetical protein
MQNSSSNLNAGRFLRLIALSSTEMLLSTPFSTWVLVQNIGAIVPAQSWADVHYQFSRIYYASLTDRSWTATTFALVNFSRWIPVFTAFLYFAFFGMQEEAMSGYVSAWGAMTRAFGRLAGFLPGSPSSSVPLLLIGQTRRAWLTRLPIILCWPSKSPSPYTAPASPRRRKSGGARTWAMKRRGSVCRRRK